ncbi:MAG: DUF4258 domain-containing protein [Chloroflexota bacterium]
MKQIRFSRHASQRMLIRGATESEVKETIHTSKWSPALENKQQARRTYKFEQPSPISQQVYKSKTVHAIFVEENDEIIVVTVMVYYGDEE